MATENNDLRNSYSEVLKEYLQAQSEKALYEASLLAKLFVEQGIGPEEIVALHSESIDEASKNLPPMERARVVSASFQFLLEIMITYGVRYKEYIDLKMSEATRAIQMQLEIDRIKAEESIKSQELSIKSKEEFLAFVAHELRNPLTVIMGSINYMLRGVEPITSGRQTTLLERTRESAEQLLRLINDLLSISQMESSEETLDVNEVDMDEIMDIAVGGVQDMAGSKSINIEVRLPRDGKDKTYGDRKWLVQMMNNLLTNAVKYTQDGGKVWVETSRTGRRLRIDVGDTGIGIAPEVIPHIFDKFYRVKGGQSPFVEGTGLGLSLVKRIVEKHGGDVSVKSKTGEGSVFTVLLPLAE